MIVLTVVIGAVDMLVTVVTMVVTGTVDADKDVVDVVDAIVGSAEVVLVTEGL